MADAPLVVEIDLDREATAASGSGSPMDPEELEDLRWYLEDYLQTPFGVYSDRGSRIAERLPEWGKKLFSAVLGPDRMTGKYAGAPAPGAAEIVLRSASPHWLGLPWELMRAPDAPGAAVLEGTGISRSLQAGPGGGPADAAGERLRVLMVISRPGGARDVGYQMIARPLLRSIAFARAQVDLEVLRPPTLEALAARLGEAHEAGTPFQIVHFDGHGVIAGEGALVFETPGGGADYVAAGRLAGILSRTGVPVAVLNACRSGAMGKSVEAAVATGLLSGGICGVIAMSYRVYAVAAAEFMTAFYDRLLAGGTVSEAVRAGRSRMAGNPGRPSPQGELPLEDWVVPVYYRSREVRFPQLRAPAPGTGAGEGAYSPAPSPAGLAGTGQDSDPLAPAEEFVGRDDLFCILETAARTDRVVVLHGSAGTGKTELAKAFGRWWRDTGGVDRPDGVCWHSFEPGIASLGLDGAILETGLRLCGPEFALKDPGTRRDLVLEQLRAQRLLLVWDNFESVGSMPSGITGPLGDTARGELREFLREAAADGRSMILITSRAPEAWLGDVRRVTVGGLLPHEAARYADQVLEPFPAAAARRAERSFAELLEWLDGHPLSMRLILPHLATTEPAAVLAGLQGTRPLLAADDAGMRSLAASLGYSVVHLPAATRRLLVALSLLRSVADTEILAAFSAQEHAPARFRGVSAAEWDMVLDEAARVGLLIARGDGGYGIHPALPAYLAAQWQAEEPGSYAEARAASDRALLDAYAAASKRWGTTMDAEASAEAYALIDRNRRMMGRMLGYALDNRLWDAAAGIFPALHQYLDNAGLGEEARSWTARARRALDGPGGVPPSGDMRKASTPVLTLWIVVVLAEGNRLRRAGDLDAAEAQFTDILRVMDKVPVPATSLAVPYAKLGFVAEERGQPDAAADMYKKALSVQEEAGDWRGIADSLRLLGSVAQDQGRWDAARENYRRALTILQENAGEPHQLQLTYDKLGDLARLRERLDEADEWYCQSLAIAERRHDSDGMARSMHSLGILSRKRGQLPEAESWFRRSLTLAERARDRPGMAASYHELGQVASRRGQGEAGEWFRLSLELHQNLGDRGGVASDKRALGLLAIKREEWDEARQQLTESLAIEEDIGRQAGVVECYHQIALVDFAQRRFDEAEQRLRRLLAIEQEMGHEAGAAVCCLQLAVLAMNRDRAGEGLEWSVRSLASLRRLTRFTDYQEPLRLLCDLTARLGIGALEECWERITGDVLPPDIRQLAVANQNADEPPEGQ